MKLKAIVFMDNGEQWEFIPRWVGMDKNGVPDRICAPNGMQYREFRIWDDSKENNFRG